MKLTLSKDARRLLIRSVFMILALGAVYGVWDNREFLTRFPFYFLAIAELLFAVVFGYLAYKFPKATSKPFIIKVLLGFLVYSVLVSLGSSYYHAINLGFAQVAAGAGLSIPLYIFHEILYLGILPGVAIGVFVHVIRKY